MAGQLRGALIDQAVSVAGALALATAVYVALRPDRRRELATAAVSVIRRLSGAERRAWLRSGAAGLARYRREILIAQEWAPEAFLEEAIG